MADIVFNYDQMQKAVTQIQDIATKYQTAATTLNQDFKSAVSPWEGESHNAMVGFMDNGVLEYTHETVPQLLQALAELLQANIDQMSSADQQIAENIPQTLQT